MDIFKTRKPQPRNACPFSRCYYCEFAINDKQKLHLMREENNKTNINGLVALLVKDPPRASTTTRQIHAPPTTLHYPNFSANNSDSYRI
jgi:hypothetical protein